VVVTLTEPVERLVSIYRQPITSKSEYANFAKLNPNAKADKISKQAREVYVTVVTRRDTRNDRDSAGFEVNCPLSTYNRVLYRVEGSVRRGLIRTVTYALLVYEEDHKKSRVKVSKQKKCNEF
jgi:hypothetical protein